MGGNGVLRISWLELSLILLPNRVVGVAIVRRLLRLPVVAFVFVRSRDGLMLLGSECLVTLVVERLEHHLPLLEHLRVFVKSLLNSSWLMLLLVE